MKPRAISSLAFCFLAALRLASPVWANVRVRIPEDLEPPLFTGSVAPFVTPDGSVFAFQNGDWAAISFARPTEAIPPDSDLLGIDFRAFGTGMTVQGFAILANEQSNVPLSTEVQGQGAVPVWFVGWNELQAAIADGSLLFSELEALPSLIKGKADYYQEQNHFATHQVSHLAVVARGTLDDGRTFSLTAVEVALQLVHVEIEFE